MLEPPVAATLEEAIAWEVELIEGELRRVDQKLRALGWGRSVRGRRVAERWDEIALGIRDDGRDDGDDIARTALQGKRAALLFQLGRLRSRLTGPPRGDHLPLDRLVARR